METVQSIQCPHCNQQIHGVLRDANVPRIRLKTILSLKEEIYCAIDSGTTFGKNQLHSMLDTIFDRKIEDV